MLARLSLLALASIASAAPIAQMDVVAAVVAAVSAPESNFTSKAAWYLQNEQAGDCGMYSYDTDLVVGLPTPVYNATGPISSWCGSFIVATNTANNKSVTARVATSSATNDTLTFSVAAWRAVDGDNSAFETASWRFATPAETSAAEAALTAAAVSSPSTSAAGTVQAQAAAETTTKAQAQATTTYAPATTTKQTYAAATTTKATSSGSGGSFSGQATWFTQNGVAGACGSVNSDSTYLVALDSAIYSQGKCGSNVRVCSGGNCITAKVADECPTCASAYSLDLSQGAFQALGSLGAGVLSITWSWA